MKEKKITYSTFNSGEALFALLLSQCWFAFHCGTASTPTQLLSLVMCCSFTLPIWRERNCYCTVCLHGRSVWMPDNPIDNVSNPAEYTRINNNRSQ